MRPKITMEIGQATYDELLTLSETIGSPPEAAPGDELPALPLDLRDFQLQQEKRLLQRSLQQAKYHQKQAAELLGLTYHQLRALLKKHQL